MKVSLVCAIWVWWALVVVPALVRPIIIEEKGSLRYNTVTFDLAEADEYSSSMTSLRNQLKDTTPVCQIPITRKTAADSLLFVLVDLTTTTSKTLTLAIDVTNVYVVAYRDKYQNKDRANFLLDASSVARKNLFTGAAVRNITFGGSYSSLEGAAKQTRANIELGVSKLEYAIESVYGKQTINGQLEAKFLLIAIQMVSEAARFKYIENEVVNSGLWGSFKPDPKMLSLENNWGTISEAIHKSAPTCTTISPPLTLTNPNNAQWKVGKVSDIRPDMGILKFKDTKLTRSTSHLGHIVWSIVPEDDGVIPI